MQPKWGIYPPGMNLIYIGTVDDVDLWTGLMGKRRVYTLVPSMSETFTGNSIPSVVAMLPKHRRGIIDVLRAMVALEGDQL